MTKLDTKTQDNSIFRLLGDWKDGDRIYNQTEYPTIPVEEQYKPTGLLFAPGEICEYTGEDHRSRISDAELRA